MLRTLKEDSNELKDNSRDRITRSILAEVSYGFTERIAADVFMSYVIQERTINQFGKTDFISTHGLRDMVLLFKYRISNPRDTRQNLMIGIGSKIPTGRSDFTREDGIILSADLQPGSGAWDALMYGFYNRSFGFRPSMGFSASVVYGLKGINPDYFNGQSYQFGNEILAQLAIVEKFTLGKQIFDLGLTLRYRHQGEDEFNQRAFPNTGGYFLFLTPVTTYFITSGMSLNFSADLPIYAHVTGTQLAPTYRFNIGVFLLINKKNRIKNLKF